MLTQQRPPSKHKTYLERMASLFESVGDAAQMLGVSRQRVHELIHQGDLEAVRIGKLWYISSLSLQERLERRRPTTAE